MKRRMPPRPGGDHGDEESRPRFDHPLHGERFQRPHAKPSTYRKQAHKPGRKPERPQREEVQLVAKGRRPNRARPEDEAGTARGGEARGRGQGAGGRGNAAAGRAFAELWQRHHGKPETDAPRARPIRPARSDKPVLWKPGPDARTVRAESGQRLATFVAHMHPGLSVRAARRLVEEGCCRVNGRIETFGSRPVESGEVVEVFLPQQSREHRFDRNRILHEDENFFAYDKPAWLPVTPVDGPKSWSLKDILLQSISGPVIPVHRLDADTSGIVLFAKNERTARALEELFRDHLIQKTYQAIVRGHPRESGERRSYLVKVDSGQGYERWKSGKGPDAREAITTWEVEARLGHYASQVRISPQTGRYHQIRIHFSEMGHPIYGDRIYGDRQDPIHVGRHLLHASTLRLPERKGGGGPALEIKAKLPREFLEAQKQLEKL